MKHFLIGFLTTIIFAIGWFSLAFYLIIPGFYWYHIFLFAGLHLITVPAMLFWKDYFTDLFFEDKEN